MSKCALVVLSDWVICLVVVIPHTVVVSRFNCFSVLVMPTNCARLMSHWLNPNPLRLFFCTLYFVFVYLNALRRRGNFYARVKRKYCRCPGVPCCVYACGILFTIIITNVMLFKDLCLWIRLVIEVPMPFKYSISRDFHVTLTSVNVFIFMVCDLIWIKMKQTMILFK